jgi:hypothetical protein
MTPESATFFASGGACLVVSVLAIYRFTPRNGSPASLWTRTEARATAVALALVIMLTASVALLVRGIMA